MSSLAALLGDELALYAIARDYYHADDHHWFFKWQCSELDEIVDEITERASLLGGRTLGTVAQRLKEVVATGYSTPQSDTREMLSDLLDRHQMMVRARRRHLEACTKIDADMLDFLFRVMQRHEMMAWMLHVIVGD